MNKLITTLVLGAAALGLSSSAYAVATLRVSDGVNPAVTISDGSIVPGATDFSTAAGQVGWFGSIGAWALNIHVGTTFPVIGSLKSPQLDLSFNATGAAGTLTLEFSADGFGPTSGSVLAELGTTVNSGGSVTYSTYGGTNNTLFSTVNLLTTQGPVTGAFGGTASGALIDNAGPYSLTQVVTIVHAGYGITTGDAKLTVPDSGSSLVLLGAGLAALGLISRRRNSAV